MLKLWSIRYTTLQLWCEATHGQFIFIFIPRSKMVKEWPSYTVVARGRGGHGLNDYSWRIIISCTRSPSRTAVISLRMLFSATSRARKWTSSRWSSVCLSVLNASDNVENFSCVQHYIRRIDKNNYIWPWLGLYELMMCLMWAHVLPTFWPILTVH